MENIVYKKSDDIVTREVNGEYVIVPLSENVADMTAVFTLKDVGAFIWDKIDGQRTTSDIVRLITEAYDVEEPQAENDLKQFIDDLGNLISS